MSYDKEYWANQIGQTIRKQRERQQLSLEKLSLLTGATVPNLSKIERGKANITLSTMVSICDALRIELPELFGDRSIHPTGHVRQSLISKGGYNLEDDD